VRIGAHCGRKSVSFVLSLVQVFGSHDFSAWHLGPNFLFFSNVVSYSILYSMTCVFVRRVGVVVSIETARLFLWTRFSSLHIFVADPRSALLRSSKNYILVLYFVDY
jgi:hypothetical protein